MGGDGTEDPTGGIEAFVREHHEPVWRALSVALGDRDVALDATQEAFAQAWRSWRRVSAMDRPVAWTYVVAMNRARRHLRREAHRPAPLPAADAVDPTEAMAGDVSLRDAVSALPPRQRAAVVLRYLGDLTIDEVAEAMGCAPGTVKSTLHAALARLRVDLAEGAEQWT